MRRAVLALALVGLVGLACTQNFDKFEASGAEIAETPFDASTGTDASSSSDAGTDATTGDAGPCTSAPQSCLDQRSTCRDGCDDAYEECEDDCPNGAGGFNCRLNCFNVRTQCRSNCNAACRTCAGACTEGCG